MKKIFTILASAILAGGAFTGSLVPQIAAQQTQSQIKWETNYAKALEEANARSLPLVLFFTGSDWCGWCHKLEDEVLNQAQFSQMAQEKYIFVLLDFPKRSAQAPELKSQNEALRNKFSVRGYPSLVIIDGKENVIAQTGYQQGGAASYASHLAQLTQGKKMEFEAVQLADDIATDEPQNLDQLRDEYRKLVGKGEINSSGAQVVRAALLAGDHGRQMHYSVALIDFEVLSIEMERGQREPDQAVLPLVEYLERFGEIDSDSWRVELTIAQVYFEENYYNEALEYANRAHAHAPEKVKAEIEEVISSIQTSLNDHGEVAAAGN